MIGYSILIASLIVIVWGIWLCFNPSAGMQMLVDTVGYFGISISLENAAIVGGLSMIAMGIVAIGIVMVGMGRLLKGQKIMWFIAIVLYAVSFAPCLYTVVVSIMNGDGWGPAGPFPVAVAVLVVLYLLRPEVKENYGF